MVYILDESVSLSCLGNLVNFNGTGMSNQLHHLVCHILFSSISQQVWGIVYLSTAYQSPLIDKQQPHTFFVYT